MSENINDELTKLHLQLISQRIKTLKKPLVDEAVLTSQETSHAKSRPLEEILMSNAIMQQQILKNLLSQNIIKENKGLEGETEEIELGKLKEQEDKSAVNNHPHFHTVLRKKGSPIESQEQLPMFLNAIYGSPPRKKNKLKKYIIAIQFICKYKRYMLNDLARKALDNAENAIFHLILNNPDFRKWVKKIKTISKDGINYLGENPILKDAPKSVVFSLATSIESLVRVLTTVDITKSPSKYIKAFIKVIRNHKNIKFPTSYLMNYENDLFTSSKAKVIIPLDYLIVRVLIKRILLKAEIISKKPSTLLLLNLKVLVIMIYKIFQEAVEQSIDEILDMICQENPPINRILITKDVEIFTKLNRVISNSAAELISWINNMNNKK
jgi:hypothetical protein